MAQNRTLDEAVEELFKDYKKAIKVAAQEATEKAKNDLHVNAISCLVNYYDNYPTPSYNRTYSLKDSFVPYSKPVKERFGQYICVAGVEFDPSLIATTYSGSEIYSPTDAEWIIDNFLMGIHPRTDGSTEVGGGNYEYEKYQGTFIPAYEMQKYIDRYYNIFDNNFRSALSRQVLKLRQK